MSKNAPCARSPSGQTVACSPAATTIPSPPLAGMIALPQDVFLTLISVIVSPFYFAPESRWSAQTVALLMPKHLMHNILEFETGAGHKASYTT